MGTTYDFQEYFMTCMLIPKMVLSPKWVPDGNMHIYMYASISLSTVYIVCHPLF